MSDPFSTKGKAEMRRLIQTMKTEPVPVIMPRWMLYLLYSMFAILGVTLATFGSVSINFSTPQGYIFPYGVSIFITSVGALVGAIATRHQPDPTPRLIAPELAAVILLFGLLSVYIASSVVPWIQGDAGKGSLGVVVTLTALIPFMRLLTLGRQVIARLVRL